MYPVSPVMPGSESIEWVIAKDQPEYLPLPAVFLDSLTGPMISRWRFTDEERKAIADGANLILTQLTFRAPFRPIHLQVVMPDTMPVLLE